MSVLVDENTRLLVQGFTGEKAPSTRSSAIAYGTKVVGGVMPGKGGTTHLTGCRSSTPSPQAVKRDRRQRLASSSCRRRSPPTRSWKRPTRASPLVVCITEGIPVPRHGEGLAVPARRSPTRLIGPNCPGIISPGEVQDRHHAGPHPQGRRVSAWFRARGTLTYEAVGQLTAARHRPIDLHRHRRRPDHRHELHRRARPVQRRPGHRRHRHDRRDRRQRRRGRRRRTCGDT